MEIVLPACMDEFRKIKQMAERAMAQLDWDQCQARINPQQNSVAVIVKHIAGNLRSRWRDFLTTDGEKPDRNREGEFSADYPSREAMMAEWDASWQVLFDALAPLGDADLGRTVYIRKEPHTVFMAINRQTSHYANHVGQILLIAKHLRGEAWQYLTIAPGETKAYNAARGL